MRGSSARIAARAGALLSLSVGLAAPAASQGVQVADNDPRLEKCLVGMLHGYESGLEESFCAGLYDLPSPFLFKCARQIRTGFQSEAGRAACAAYLEKTRDRAALGHVRASP